MRYENSARCRRRRIPKECYIKAHRLSFMLLGKKQLEKRMKIKKIIPHPNYYHPKIIYDVALLELEKPLKCTGKTSPICLPTKEMYKTGQKIYIAGWGNNRPKGMGKNHI
ncbi:hypothetical protein TNIN_42511 [Trichonephila inaurata madagascariensis]|uniref:Peptidase S1 domain-containing protein n=1 Tax=Trichonephila inaurata madagascariensis TaxID=2747483 RepID=A0A8X6XFX8_9ARAC|nr:hypothetical protein TNIN_42511 [Trichonephila inaurata madagascariensis]